MNNLILQGTCFLDVETVPQYSSYDELPDRFKPLWEKRFSKMPEALQNKDLSSADGYDLCGLIPEFCKIVCISVGMLSKKEDEFRLKLKSYYGHDEKKILSEFVTMLDTKNEKKELVIQRLCAHNGKDFDFPLLGKRILINGLILPEHLNIAGKKPWEISHIDTKEFWKFGSYKDSVSLDLLAAVLGLPTPKDEMDGSQVGKAYWIEKRIEDIKNYCERKDVVTLVNVALKLNGFDALKESEIEYSTNAA